MQSISAIIITHNEEKHISECIRSLQGVAQEIIVVDSHSTDETAVIAHKLGARVIEKSWDGYSNTKNWANLRANGEYILSLDGDEMLSDKLRDSIITQKHKGLEGVYAFNRMNNYCGKWMKHGGWYPDIKERLFPKKDVLWEGAVHEKLIHPYGKPSWLKGDLLHFSIASKAEHIEKEKKYARLAGPYSSKVQAFASALHRFLYMYLFRGGFLDGMHGFQLAWISARSRIWRNQ